MQQGYKNTDIGIIPEDWGCVAAKHLMRIETGSRNTEHKTDTGKYPFFVRSQKVEHIDTYHYDCEAVLTAGDGVGTGKVFHHYVGKFDAHQRVYVMSNFDGITGRYFYNYFSENFGKEVSKYTAKSSVDSVRRDMIAEMIIPLPPIEEQDHIAEALSDVDGMISSLEKLIAKKKAVKQGAMQELLTGKKRLPGFTGEWKKYKLGDICCISGRIGFRGYTKNDLVNKGFGAITFSPSDIFEQKLDYSNCDYISFFKYDESPEIQVFNGDIIFCKTASIGKTALIKNLTEKATINPQFVLMNKFKCNNEFLYYIISGKEFVEQILSITGGSTIPTISQEQLKMQLICMPEIEEQTAIASILSDMDNEIESLEQKLVKTRQIKQGMMQQLLTGKIRLV